MTVDLSRLPAPAAITVLDYEAMLSAQITEFLARWDAMRAVYPDTPAFDTASLNGEPAIILLQAVTYMRRIDRLAVNEAVAAVLAPLARGADLDNIVAWQGLERLVVVPATVDTPAVMESDERLLLRYLVSFERASAGSRDAYLYDAYTAAPTISHAAVCGWREHSRRGDVDLVILGAGGEDASDEVIDAIIERVTGPSRKPEAVALTVLRATRRLWSASVTIEIPSGPDPTLVAAEAEARIRAVALERRRIGGEVPADAVLGAAYGPSVIRAWMTEPMESVPPDYYTAPILDELTVTTVIRS